MSNQVWILVAVVVIVAIVVAYQRSRQSQMRQTRDLRMGAQELSRAQSPSEEISNQRRARAEPGYRPRAQIQKRKPACSGTGISRTSAPGRSRDQKTCPRRPSMHPGGYGERGILLQRLRARGTSPAKRPGELSPGHGCRAQPDLRDLRGDRRHGAEVGAADPGASHRRVGRSLPVLSRTCRLPSPTHAARRPLAASDRVSRSTPGPSRPASSRQPPGGDAPPPAPRRRDRPSRSMWWTRRRPRHRPTMMSPWFASCTRAYRDRLAASCAGSMGTVNRVVPGAG